MLLGKPPFRMRSQPCAEYSCQPTPEPCSKPGLTSTLGPWVGVVVGVGVVVRVGVDVAVGVDVLSFITCGKYACGGSVGVAVGGVPVTVGVAVGVREAVGVAVGVGVGLSRSTCWATQS